VKCVLAMIRVENWRIAHYGDIKLWRVVGELKFGVSMATKLEKNMEKTFREILETT